MSPTLASSSLLLLSGWHGVTHTPDPSQQVLPPTPKVFRAESLKQASLTRYVPQLWGIPIPQPSRVLANRHLV